LEPIITFKQQLQLPQHFLKQTSGPMIHVELKECSTLTNSGNEKSQSLSMGKIGSDYVVRVQC